MWAFANKIDILVTTKGDRYERSKITNQVVISFIL